MDIYNGKFHLNEKIPDTTRSTPDIMNFKKVPVRDIQWTVIDDFKLDSIDRLHRRSRECQHVAHTVAHSSAVIEDESADHEIVLQYVYYDNAIPFSDKLVVTVRGCEMTSFFDRIGGTRSGGFLWVNIIDCNFIDIILTFFRVHIIFQSYFHDHRPHSSLLESSGGSFFSLSSCSLNPTNNECRMTKLYMFANANLLITFEHELLPDVSNIFGQSEANRLQHHNNNKSIDSITTSTIASTVASNIIRQLPKSYALYCQLGVSYLLFEMIVETVRQQSTLLQFCSIAIYYFKNLIRKNHQDLFDGFIDRKVRVIESCLVLMEMQALDSASMMTQLAAGSRKVNHILGKVNVNAAGLFVFNGIDNGACIDALVDSFVFITSNLKNELAEVRAVHSDMASLSTIRQSKTGITLSLVATVFLPMTFLTGVFGMNFQFAGGNGMYTIPIVNNPDGPMYFLYMCLATAAAAIVYFILNGWLNPGNSIHNLLWWLTTPFRPHRDVDELRPDNRRVMSTAATLAKELREAEEEESRRSDRATFIKSHIHFNNVTTSRGISRASDVTGIVGGVVDLRYSSSSFTMNNGSFASPSSIQVSTGSKPNIML